MNDRSTELESGIGAPEPAPQPGRTITVAAIGDLHVRENNERRYRELFAEISEVADVLALAGDLTDFGKTGEAELLAEDLRACTIPMVGVLGNHDFESGQPEEVAEIMRQAGVVMLDDQATMIDGVGFAGVKGFIGGFGRGELGAFGEDAIKVFVDESLNEARKLENQLRTLRTDRIMAILHYSPIAATVEGDRWKSSPSWAPSAPCRCGRRVDNVKAVRHGHAHRGAFRGETRGACQSIIARSSWCRRPRGGPTPSSTSERPMKAMTEQHLAVFPPHMVEVVDVHFDSRASDEIGHEPAEFGRARSRCCEWAGGTCSCRRKARRHRTYHDGPLPIGFVKTDLAAVHRRAELELLGCCPASGCSRSAPGSAIRPLFLPS
jgi:Icc-related predicted phosphoesterase